jgi:uncharacterized protein (TIGR03067 family)
VSTIAATTLGPITGTFSLGEMAMRLRALALVVVFSLMVSSGTGQDKAGAGDKDKIQDTWGVASGKAKGKDLPADFISDVKFVFAGDKLTMIKMGKKMEWTFKLDPTKKPKEIDVKFEDGTGKGIYELDGDTLKIAHGEMGDPRPTDFVSKEGSQVSVIVLMREKARKK